MSAPGEHRPAAEHGVEHQPFDAEIRIRTILWIGAGLGGLAILGALVGWGLLVMLRGWHQRAEPPAPVIPEARQAPMVPGPRLLATPERELAALRAAEEEALHAYRWLDQQGGVASIPVERAIELALERGIPAAPVAGAPPDPSGPGPGEPVPTEPAPHDRDSGDEPGREPPASGEPDGDASEQRAIGAEPAAGEPDAS